MSLTYFAPMISNAQVSEANTGAPLRSPRTNGLIPKGSLTPINFLLVRITREYAPCILNRASMSLSTVCFLEDLATSCRMVSVSEVD